MLGADVRVMRAFGLLLREGEDLLASLGEPLKGVQVLVASVPGPAPLWRRRSVDGRPRNPDPLCSPPSEGGFPGIANFQCQPDAGWIAIRCTKRECARPPVVNPASSPACRFGAQVPVVDDTK